VLEKVSHAGKIQTPLCPFDMMFHGLWDICNEKSVLEHLICFMVSDYKNLNLKYVEPSTQN
jgi:hypothetical protein